MSRRTEGDHGGVSIQSLLGLIIILVIIYASIVFFPVVHIPYEIKRQVIEDLDAWLRLPDKAKKAAIHEAERDVKETVKALLENQEYDEKKLRVEFTGLRRASVDLTYTIRVDFMGMVFRYDKELNVSRQAVRF
jgi:hypothetical protein